MTFETERLVLRPWQEEDAEALYEYARDPLVGPAAGWPPHTSVENSREIIRTVLSEEGTYAVCLKENEKPVGSIGLFPPCQKEYPLAVKELEVGYWIAVPFWGKGLIPEAVRRLEEHAFLDLGCTALWCGFHLGNEKSRRCQAKCGFRPHHVEYGVSCPMIDEKRDEQYTRLTKEEWLQERKAVLYVHGKGGSPEEAGHYRSLFPGHAVIGFDYKAETPWEAIPELRREVDRLLPQYGSLLLVANSLGAYFSLLSLGDKAIRQAFLISPVVDMEELILNMLHWSGLTEEELKEKGTITALYGDEFSWEYLAWVREHPVSWTIPTKVLYGEKDNLQSFSSILGFVDGSGAELTVMPEGEHWFHTERQMDFLDSWITGDWSRPLKSL